MKKKPPHSISEEDRDLFRQAVAGTRPLDPSKVQSYRPPRPSLPKRQESRDREDDAFADMLSDESESEQVGAADALWFQRPGLQTTVVRKLRRGQIPCEAELDLHGYRINDARPTVARFLDRAQQQGMHCVRIIHGKGYGSGGDKPILKNKLNNWLRQRHEVLAFCSARAVDGGTGAVYVLLRRA